MRRQFHPAVALVAVLLSASACTSADDGPTETPVPGSTATSAPNASGTASPSLPGATATVPDDLRTRPAVAAAITARAASQGVEPSAVVVASWSPVTWNDGSLGCPAVGQSYTQATVDGELLMLRVGSQTYSYHARKGGLFAYCAKPSAAYSVSG